MTTRDRRSFYWKQTDKEILGWLAEYHYLQPIHLQLLSGRNIISIRRRVRQLLDQGWLKRMTVPFERNAPVWSPPDQYVYYLSSKGRSILREIGHADDGSRPTRDKSVGLLPHDLFLTTFHLCLALAAMASSSIRLTFWEQRRSALQDAILWTNSRSSINPDALFFIKNEEAPPEANTTYYFLEYERSRQTGYQNGETSYVRKMRAFETYHRSGRDLERWGMPNFRVLTIAPSSERALTLCRSLAEADPPLTRQRFWFTDTTHISLDHPQTILDDIFFDDPENPERRRSLWE